MSFPPFSSIRSATSWKGRYASMEELKAQLEKIIKIARPVEEKIETAKNSKESAVPDAKNILPTSMHQRMKKISAFDRRRRRAGIPAIPPDLWMLRTGAGLWASHLLGLHKPGEKKESDDIALSRPSEDDGAGWIE